jgi:hypothetical protein
MRVAVIRGDVPSPIFLADLEPTSQFNPPTEPFGQTQYIEYPSATALTLLMAGVYTSDSEGPMPGDFGEADNDRFVVTVPTTLPIPPGQNGYGGVPAALQSTSAPTFPVVLTSANNQLEFKNASAASPTTVVVPAGTYATMTTLLVALNSVLVPTGLANATTDSTGTLVVIQSSVPGVGSYIQILVAGADPINTILHLPTASFTMPTASAIITALNPVVVPPATGSLNVSAAALLTEAGASPNTVYIANFIAPQFLETEVAVQSYQAGNLAGYLKLTWNPDSRLLPPITSGPAIQVVENDGHTAFSSSPLAPFPMITAAVHNSPNTGDITITGVGLGNAEFFNGTVVRVTAAASAVAPGFGAGVGDVPFVRLSQAQITSVESDSVALTGTFQVATDSASVFASLSQTGLLFPGNQIVFSVQPDTVYEVSTVASTSISLTSVYTGPSNEFSLADTPKTIGSVSNTTIVIPAALLKYIPGGNPFPPSSYAGLALGVAGSTVEVQYATFANTNYGTAASVSAWAGNVSTLTGLTNQFTSLVNLRDPTYITVSGAASPGNNGTFPILSVVSPTSVTISNIYGVAGDAHNGALVWSEPAPIAFVVT